MAILVSWVPELLRAFEPYGSGYNLWIRVHVCIMHPNTNGLAGHLYPYLIKIIMLIHEIHSNLH